MNQPTQIHSSLLTPTEVHQLLKPSSILPCWQVKRGYGTFLTLDMGERVSKQKKDGSKYLQGSVHLWIYLCDWIVLCEGVEIVSSETIDSEEITKNLNHLLDKRLLDIQFDKEAQYVSLIFSDNYTIVLSRDDDEFDPEDDFFMLFLPDETIICCNALSGLYCEKDNFK